MMEDIAMSADDRWLACIGEDQNLYLWDVASGKLKNSYEVAESERNSVGVSSGFSDNRQDDRTAIPDHQQCRPPASHCRCCINGRG